MRELRLLSNLLQEQKKGASLGSLFTQFHIWEKRQPGVRAFMKRHSLESSWQQWMQAARIDHIIKGAEKGQVWQELESFLISLTNGL
jgi:DNA polymerase III delta subunit